MRSFLALLLGLVLVSPSLAQETRHAIVVPTQLGGFIPNKSEVQQSIDILIADRLKRAKVQVMENPPWLPEELNCHDDVCLAQLANRHNVEVAVTASLVNDEQKNNAYHITVRLFVKGESPSVRERNVTCDYCSEDKATDLLATTVAQAYANSAEPAAPTPTPTSQVVASMPQPASDYPTPTQKFLRAGSIVLFIGGAAAIGLGGWKASQNGSVACGPVCEERSTVPGMATAFAVGGVAIVAAIPMAIYGWKHPSVGKTMAGGK